MPLLYASNSVVVENMHFYRTVTLGNDFLKASISVIHLDSVCSHTLPCVGHCKTGFSGLVTFAAAIISSSGVPDVHEIGCTMYQYIAQNVE